MMPWTMMVSVSMSIFIRSPVSLVFSLPSIEVIVMTKIPRDACDNLHVSHNSGEAVCRAIPHRLETSSGDEGLAFRGEQIML